MSPGSNPALSNDGNAERARAAFAGGGIAYFSRYPASGATRSGFYYLARRNSSGWSIAEVAPQDSPHGAELLSCAQSVYFSPDLSRSVLGDGWNAEEEVFGESYCQSSEEALVAGAPAGFGNLYWREGEGPYRLVNLTPESATPANARLEDATGDLSHVLFGENARLTPPPEEPPAGYNLYEWAEGALRLVTFLPGGEPVEGRLADGGSPTAGQGAFVGHFQALAPVTHAMSVDGERVFFYAEHEGSVGLYLREHATQPQSAISGGVCTEPAKACTIQIDVSHSVGASGDGVFWDASADGSRVFFADEHRLTAGSGAVNGKPDLYEYDVETGQLSDITPEALAGTSANARGFSGASEDGSYVYFVAKGALTGSQQNSQGGTAKQGEPNLYLLHEGALAFVAKLNASTDYSDWQEKLQDHEPNMGLLTARTSPSGRYIGFNSINSITGVTGSADMEIFLYDAASGQLSCVSCDPRGGPPVGPSELPEPTRFSQTPFGAPAYLSRNVLDDGTVFFTTPNSLVAQDENGVADVYEYKEGSAHLISTGTSNAGSTFYDASASGGDVFFVTAQGLVGSDTDNNDSLYDARVEGGFPEPPPPAAACETQQTCHGGGSTAAAGLLTGTRVFTGPGNVKVKRSQPSHRCRKGRVRRHGRCVKRKRRGARGRRGRRR